MTDENLNWQSHIKLAESKISKNIQFVHFESTLEQGTLINDIFLIYKFINSFKNSCFKRLSD